MDKRLAEVHIEIDSIRAVASAKCDIPYVSGDTVVSCHIDVSTDSVIKSVTYRYQKIRAFVGWIDEFGLSGSVRCGESDIDAPAKELHIIVSR